MITKAIVRTPATDMASGITGADLGKPDMKLTFAQHEGYVEALRKAGVEVTVLEAQEDYPDSVFVEDVAVMIPTASGVAAIITRPGAGPRRGEVENMKSYLKTFVSELFEITDPGFMEGGDVMLVKDTFYVGVDKRTNQSGCDQFAAVVEKLGYKCICVPFENGIPHLKTEMSQVAENTLLIAERFADRPEFKDFKKIIAPKGESYAANCLFLGETLLMPAGFPKTRAALVEEGLNPVEVEMTEFRKMDGGLTCLSLRF
jgi:dimethylargininase